MEGLIFGILRYFKSKLTYNVKSNLTCNIMWLFDMGFGCLQ